LVLHLADAQYRFGAGPLICRVVDVLDLLHLDDGPPWWHLRGECAHGVRARHGGRHVRELYVVGTAVRRPGPAQPQRRT
jgi:hypothetical protein